LILGAGFGGLELATRLPESLAGEVHVALVDQNDAFVFGFSSRCTERRRWSKRPG
jgi:sulfide:quinone oxidoreductase